MSDCIVWLIIALIVLSFLGDNGFGCNRSDRCNNNGCGNSCGC